MTIHRTAPPFADRRIPKGGGFLSREELSKLTPQELVARTTALKPLLAANAEACERLRRPVDEVWEAIRATGVFYHFVPKRFGGLEFDIETYIDAMLPLAEGCASTAWVTAFCVEHNWMAAQLPEAGQRAIFSEYPYIIAPGVTNPPGEVVPVEGGYRVSGHWKWGTGVMHADWVMVGGSIAGEDPPRTLLLVLPADQAEVLDVWHVEGMAGTGSNDIVVRDVFVPESHVADFGKMRDGQGDGATIHGNPIYAMPMLPFLCVAASLPVLGAARSAVDHFRARLSQRVIHNSGIKQEDKPASQIRLARADMLVRNAEMLVRDVARRNLALAGKPGLKIDERVELRAQVAYALELCREAVRIVVEASGASMHFLSNPIQRAMRDIAVASGHTVYDLDTAFELRGRSLLGLPPNSWAI